jgi:hypothetical protein
MGWDRASAAGRSPASSPSGSGLRAYDELSDSIGQAHALAARLVLPDDRSTSSAAVCHIAASPGAGASAGVGQSDVRDARTSCFDQAPPVASAVYALAVPRQGPLRPKALKPQSLASRAASKLRRIRSATTRSRGSATEGLTAAGDAAGAGVSASARGTCRRSKATMSARRRENTSTWPAIGPGRRRVLSGTTPTQRRCGLAPGTTT